MVCTENFTNILSGFVLKYKLQNELLQYLQTKLDDISLPKIQNISPKNTNSRTCNE